MDTAFSDSLKQAALSVDRASRHAARSDDASDVDAWRRLVDGEWRLIEIFESDGRRIMIARRNASPAPLLTDRERRVLGLRARAYSVKRIAYDLRLSLASISRALTSGTKKLGLSSTDLCRFATSIDSK